MTFGTENKSAHPNQQFRHHLCCCPLYNSRNRIYIRNQLRHYRFCRYQLFHYYSSCIRYTKLQCWGSVKFWCGSGSGSPDPYLWLIDPDPAPDPDPNPDPTTFFNDFKDLRNKKNFIFFLIAYPQVHHLLSKKSNFLLKFLC